MRQEIGYLIVALLALCGAWLVWRAAFASRRGREGHIRIDLFDQGKH
ncbi:MAG TPA: hypothetical protein VF727_09310 [Allosphingosinicella sp.]|jgi:hypothetical protein